MTSSTENQLKLARVAIETNPDEAIKYSSAVLEADPDNAEAWFIKARATAQIARGVDILLRFKESMSYFDRAAQLGYAPGEIETARKEVSDSLATFACQLGTQTWNSVVSIANIRGSYRDAGGSVDTALNYYETALAMDPKFRTALTSVIHVWKELGQVGKARPYVERMKQLDPNYRAPANRVEANSNPTTSFQFERILYAIIGLLTAILAFIYMAKARR